MKYRISLLILFVGVLNIFGKAFAQDSVRVPYFPYTKGDILVYSVYEFSGEYIGDSKIIFTIDSMGAAGRRYLSLDYEGQWPVAFAFEIDSSGDIYGGGSLIYKQDAKLNTPWIVFKRDVGYDLANIRDTSAIEIFGIPDTLKGIEYYGSADSSDTIGLESAYFEWSRQFGIVYTFDYEGGPQYFLKGVVKEDVVYGDTTFYTPPLPSEIQKVYFPYKDGDVLVYSVQDSIGNALPDSKLTIAQDSVGANGSVWYSVKAEGFQPIVKQFMVDTLKNVYGIGWRQEKETPWKIFEAYNEQGVPWVASHTDGEYVLGEVYTIEQRFVFRRNLGTDIIDDVYVINYYTSPNSTSSVYEVPVANLKNRAEWTREFGVFHKKEYETGIEYSFKGGVLSGVVYGDTSAVITSLEPIAETPSSFELYQNYPNPFNPSTTIRFELARSQKISLKVYSITGQLVKVLIKGQLYNRGLHTIPLHMNGIASGVYLCLLENESERMFKKMTLIK